jgi:protein gp37
MRMAHRLEAMGRTKYAGTTKPSKRGPVWTGTIRFDKGALRAPLNEQRPTIWFVNSMSDAFHEAAKDEWRDQMFEVMAIAKKHIFQILTKRPEVAARYFKQRPQYRGLANVWLGVTVEHQETAHRLDILRTIDAAVRFASAEPLIGPIDADWSAIDWVITGGESGPHARPCEPEWAYHVADKAATKGAAIFHKQWGTWESNPLVRAGLSVAEARRRDPAPDAKGGAWWPGDKLLREMPMAAAWRE